MDYHRPLHESPQNPKVHLALLMVPGANRTDSPLSYGVSPLLLNPGGPGGSGSMFASTAGPSLQKAVGSDWDLIGFDPRGVGEMPLASTWFNTVERITDGASLTPRAG